MLLACALPAGVGRLDLRLKLLPLSIGGKLWDASLLMSAWLLENPSLLQPAGCRTPRVLEIGAGLGLVGLAVARALPDARITMSDYDPAVLRNLGESIRLNFAGAAPAAPAAALVDFRDFCEADVAALPPLPPASPLCRYEGLLGSFDVVIGSDIVYDHSHARIAALLRAMLRLAQSLLQNARCNLELYVDQIMPAIFSCLVGKRVCQLPHEDHCQKQASGHPPLPPRQTPWEIASAAAKLHAPLPVPGVGS